MNITHTTCKQTARSLRIWIEGDKLSAAGFRLTLPTQPAMTCSVSRSDSTSSLPARSVSPSPHATASPRPIIDLSNKSVGTVFEAGDALQVRFSTNRIIIERA